MKKGQRIDALVTRAENPALNGDDLTLIYTELSTCSYRMAAEVADLYRDHLLAEDARKTYHAKECLALQLQDAKLSSAKAERIVEARPEYEGLRHAEILADAEYQALKMKLDAARSVMQSLQMRLAHLRDEAKRTPQMTHT